MNEIEHFCFLRDLIYKYFNQQELSYINTLIVFGTFILVWNLLLLQKRYVEERSVEMQIVIISLKIKVL